MKSITTLCTLFLAAAATAAPLEQQRQQWQQQQQQRAAPSVSSSHHQFHISKFYANALPSGTGALFVFNTITPSGLNTTCAYSTTADATTEPGTLPDVAMRRCTDASVEWQFTQDGSGHLQGGEGNYRLVVTAPRGTRDSHERDAGWRAWTADQFPMVDFGDSSAQQYAGPRSFVMDAE